jgi:hypothetical protein
MMHALERPLKAGFKKLLRRVGGVGDREAETVLSAVSFRCAYSS